MELERVYKPSEKGTLRLVYLRPSHTGDEAIAVGVVYDGGNGVQVATVENSPNSALNCLYSDSVVDNVQFSLQLLRQNISNHHDVISGIECSASNVFLGNCKEFFADNVDKYARDYLQLASSLRSNKRGHTRKAGVTQKEISRVLFDEVSQLDVIAATRLFEGIRVPLSRGIAIDFPIYGDRVVAAPVSMLTKQVNAAKSAAEAYCAKLALARNVTKRTPVVYVLSPSIGEMVNASLVEDCIGELEIVASASDVVVRVEKNKRELAKRILHDEKGTL